jgi:hypothetical protein
MMKASNPSTGFRLTQTMLATVDTICAQQDLTRSQVFRRSIMEFIKRQGVTKPNTFCSFFVSEQIGFARDRACEAQKCG